MLATFFFVFLFGYQSFRASRLRAFDGVLTFWRFEIVRKRELSKSVPFFLVWNPLF
jgi:hypothetical protein